MLAILPYQEQCSSLKHLRALKDRAVQGMPRNECSCFCDSGEDLTIVLCVSLPCMKVIIIVVRLANDFPSFLNISFGDEPYNLSK